MPQAQTAQEKTEFEKIECLIKKFAIKDSAEYPSGERRKNALTRDDVLLVFEIARIANQHKCPFTPEEAETLQSSAKVMNKTSKVASTVIIGGTVTATVFFVWHAIRHYGLELLKMMVGAK